jgi:hypothetical protein
MSFNLHKSLVCKESILLSKAFDGTFKEAAEQKCTLSEEDPRLFGYFVEYLYRERSFYDSRSNNTLSNTIPPSGRILILARLYTMGDRLMAKGLQDVSLRRLATALAKTPDLPDQDICDLLGTVSTELPDGTVNEDPLQAQVFWYAAARMVKLQKLNRFPKMLREHPELAVRLCLRAGNSASPQPVIPETLLQRIMIWSGPNGIGIQNETPLPPLIISPQIYVSVGMLIGVLAYVHGYLVTYVILLACLWVYLLIPGVN